MILSALAPLGERGDRKAVGEGVECWERPAAAPLNAGGQNLIGLLPGASYIAAVSRSFNGNDSTERIDQAWREGMTVNPEVSTDNPQVEVSTLTAPPGGFFVLANRSAQAQKLMVTTTLPVRSLSRVTSVGLQPLRREGTGWRISLPPPEGGVLRWLP